VVWRSRLLLGVPDLVPAAMAGFAVGPMFLLVIGHFSAAAGVPLGLVGAAVACWLTGLPDEPRRRRDTVLATVALLVAIAWFFYNVKYSAQDVYNTRDPAGYTITGQWLVHHGSLQIHTLPEVFGNPPGGKVETGSFAMVDDGGVLNAQGDHLLPAFLGLSGSMFGTTALLSTNVFLSALALLAFFGLARRVIGPVLGLMAMLALALSTPFIYVGRDAYTEPLTLLYLMGALLFAHRAWTGGRTRDWAVCGLAAGAATCVRVDSYGALVGIVAAVTLYVAVARAGRRRSAALAAGAVLLGAAAPATLGYLDLTHLARQYFDSQHSNITHLIALLLAVIAISPLCVWLAWRTRVRSWLTSEGFAKWAPPVAAGAISLVFVLLATRPLWQETRGSCREALANQQQVNGIAVDCTRTYNEQTLHWHALYFGWPTIVLAFAGYAVLVEQFVRRRNYALVGALAVGLSMSVLYLYNSEVAPDQPWAMRRYVPVVIPLFLVAAGAALRWAWEWTGGRWGVRRALVFRPLVAAGVLFVVTFPLAVSWPVRHLREEYGQLAQLDAICTAIGENGAVIETDEPTIFGYGQSIRSFCDVPAIGLITATPDQLAQVAAAVRAHDRVPYVLGQCDAVTPVMPPCTNTTGTGRTSAPALAVVRVTRWPNKINTAPGSADIKVFQQQYSVWLSRLDESGVPQPVAPLIPGR
jgi:hypothetical protein